MSFLDDKDKRQLFLLLWIFIYTFFLMCYLGRLTSINVNSDAISVFLTGAIIIMLVTGVLLISHIPAVNFPTEGNAIQNVLVSVLIIGAFLYWIGGCLSGKTTFVRSTLLTSNALFLAIDIMRNLFRLIKRRVYSYVGVLLYVSFVGFITYAQLDNRIRNASTGIKVELTALIFIVAACIAILISVTINLDNKIAFYVMIAALGFGGFLEFAAQCKLADELGSSKDKVISALKFGYVLYGFYIMTHCIFIIIDLLDLAGHGSAVPPSDDKNEPFLTEGQNDEPVAQQQQPQREPDLMLGEKRNDVQTVE